MLPASLQSHGHPIGPMVRFCSSFGLSRPPLTWVFDTSRFRPPMAVASLAISLAAAPSLAQDVGEYSSAASVAPQAAISGKLATHTQIVATPAGDSDPDLAEIHHF